ncbi:MAG: hypothetical protein MUO26_15245 [Methanotrichaceae archaeon]|nr:hypothetical protein [Methanotrichaceae archaeon]
MIVGSNSLSFSNKGDNGSLIVLDNQEFNPVGLLWEGWQQKARSGFEQENWTYGICLSKILDNLGLELVARKRDFPKKKMLYSLPHNF